MKENLVIFFGGKSVEHEISVLTFFQIFKRIDESLFNIFPVYITKDNKMFLIKKNALRISNFVNFIPTKIAYQVAFIPPSNCIFKCKKNQYKSINKLNIGLNCCHGGIGENCELSALMKLCGIAFSTGSVLGLGECLNKTQTKRVCYSANIPVLNSISISSYQWNNNSEQFISQFDNIGYPLVVKPNKLGSSVGITLVNDLNELKDALSLAFEFDCIALVEKALKNFKEYNCSVIGSQFFENLLVSEIEEPLKNNQILSFADKYLCGGKSSKSTKGMVGQSRVFPANIPISLSKKIKQYSYKVFRLFNLCGVCRIDFLYDLSQNKLYLNEINTVPGSLAYYFWSDVFDSKFDFINYIIECAKKDFSYENAHVGLFNTNILNNYKA